MKDEIIQGLKMAMLKGESLQQAMQSFYNSGYEKAEIEEAAREVQGLQAQLNQESKVFNQNESIKSPEQQPSQQPQKSQQVVSNYEQPKKDHSRLMLMVIVLALLVIVGTALAGVYVYRETVMNYLTNMFG